ncbi:MAG: hypothetical protein AB1374_12385 [Bacillota bacterium]
MLFRVFRMISARKPRLREFDPTTIERIGDGSNLMKVVAETQVAARKCHYYAGNAVDQEVAAFFDAEAKKLTKGARALQKYYETMTQE